MPTVKPFKFPKSLAKCADNYSEIRDQRLALQKQVDELAAKEKMYKNHLIDNIPKSDATGIAGKVARVSVVVKDEPTVEDEAEFRKYINRTKRFDLAYKLRPSPPAIRDMWEDGKEIPGIGKFHVVSLSLSKI